MATIRTALLTSALAAVSALSQEKDAAARLLPAYQPERQVTGVIRTWGTGASRATFERKPYEVPVMTGGLDVRDHGFALVIFVHKDNPLAKLTLARLDGIFGVDHWGNDEMAALLTAWEKGFQRFHPHIQFEDRLMGPASAMAGIYTGVADISLMGHELLKEESMAFEWVFRYKALGIEVATASLDVHGNNATLIVFVHKDNPISKLTLAQLDAIYGSEHKRAPANIRTWGDLGLTGDWAQRQIHPYGYAPGSEAGSYFRQRVLKDS